MKRVSKIVDLTCLSKGEILHFKNRLNSGCFDKQPVLLQTDLRQNWYILIKMTFLCPKSTIPQS